MKKYFEILRKCSLFSGIADEDLIAILGCLRARVEKFWKRDTVISEGEAAVSVGIVLSGSVRIVQDDYYGNRSIVSQVLPSELFGESFACAGIRSMPVSIVANDNCEIMFIDCERILYSCSNACSFHRQLIFNLMKDLASKNIAFHQKIEVTSKRSTREKLMAYLLIQAKETGRRSFEIPYDRQALADYLGVERSGLSAEIGKMQREGLLKSKKNRFELL